MTEEKGLRTWFGTLTLAPQWQAEMLLRARFASPDPNAEWWEDASCDARFAAVRREIQLEVTRFWKRLRKSGHSFKYFLVYERHKSGLPHMHFLLHEQENPITKRAMQSLWPFGFSNVSIVGGRSATSADSSKAAWYVVKYLSKSVQARQVVSTGYSKTVRSPLRHSSSKDEREKENICQADETTQELSSMCTVQSEEQGS